MAKPYIVPSGYSISELEIEVARKISIGYKVIGGVAIKENKTGELNSGKWHEFFQAMILEDCDDEE
jgi:hypothetical protein